MFLKSIEIRGFKSFADRTKLDFKKGVTAVVGPNGSGKSNISDAVRWVLGEQSAKTLRGGKMDDVIFAGTQFRKPLGMAQVSLTLDNTDKELPIEYAEVVVTRRIFKSGESEYLINNRQCRLKDLVNLFMDTGIGKEGYSLIGQGKIDAILSGRPEDRRALFEEASGIVKYKTRKIESQKKLQLTDQNLIRIDDILSTYEERLEPLKEESEKANKFLTLSTELKDKEISVLVSNIDKLKSEISKIDSDLDNLKDQESVCKNDYDSSKEEIESINKTIEDLDSLDLEERRDFYKNKESKNELESEINVLKERLSNIDDVIEKNKSDIARKSGEKSNQLRIKEDTEKSLDKSNKQSSELNAELDNLKEKVNELSNKLSDYVNKQEEAKNNKIALLKMHSDKINDRNIKKEQIKNLKESFNQINSNDSNSKTLININYATRVKLEEQIRNLQIENDKLSEDVKNIKKKIGTINSSITRNEQELRKSYKEKSNIEANKNVLSRLEEQYEGYNKSVKNLFDFINKKKIDVPAESSVVLGEVINVRKDYELAIEIALGNMISNVITDDDNIAQKLITLLKSEKLGRATFLPLNIIKGRKAELSNNVKNADGFIGIASDIIDFDSKYKMAIDYTLGRVLVCTNMTEALKIAKLINYSYKIVTLDGQIVNPGGALTGGSIYSKHTSVITRKREIEELKEKEKDINKIIEEINNKLNSLRNDLSNEDEKLIDYKESINSKVIDINRLKSEVENLNREYSKLQDEVKVNSQKTEAINAKINALENELLCFDEKINDVLDERNRNDDNINSLQLKIDETTVELNEIKEKYTEKKINIATIKELLNSKEKEFSRINSTIEQFDREISHLNEEINKNIEFKVQWKNKIDENSKKIIEIGNNISSLEIKLNEREIKKEKLKEEYKNKNSYVEVKFLELNNIQDRVHKIEINKARKEQEGKNLITQLNEEYELTYADAVEKSVHIDDVNSFVKRINELKRQINMLGTVNVSAIEEYKETSEKYTFMSEQRDDLIKSKEELNLVIEQLTEKMRSIFVENFKILNNNFNETFKALFKGGSAELKLSSDDALESNIEINVEPPGKKVQNINLMSGGEKVLSAIALVFAILKMKPTPFCILDEIEAALDDANVFRYAEFLKEFSDNIQFIVITHRKGTMEAADIMYGVTMQEKGVSKVVSVDLNH